LLRVELAVGLVVLAVVVVALSQVAVGQGGTDTFRKHLIHLRITQ
jgi:hypothetical protein